MKLKFSSHLSVWLRFFIMYVLIVTTTVIITMPIYYTALKVSREKAISDSMQLLSKRFSNFEESMNEFYQVPAILEKNEAYLQIKSFSDSTIPTPYYYKANLPRDQFYLSVANIDYVDNSFIFFPRSKFIITKDRLFADIGTEFSQFIDYNIPTFELCSKLTGQKGRWHFLPTTKVTTLDGFGTKKTENVLTYVVNSYDGLAYISAMIYEKSLNELFGLSNYGLNAFGTMTDNTGQIIYSQNFTGDSLNTKNQLTPLTLNGNDFLLLSFEMEKIGCKAVIGIPNSYFVDSVRPVNRLVNFFITLAVIVGAIISFIFARYNYRPIQKLVHVLTAHGRPPRSRKIDEFSYIGDTLNSYCTENEILNQELSSMRERLRDSIFIQLLQGNIITEDARRLALETLPIAGRQYRVALIEIEFTEDLQKNEFLSMVVDKTFAHSSLSEYFMGQIDIRHFAILLEETPDWMEHLKEIVQTFRNNARPLYQINLKVGLSSTGCGTAMVHTSYEQARYALFSENEQTIHIYKPAEGTDKVLEYNIIQKLYALTLAGEMNNISGTLGEIEKVLIEPSSQRPDRTEEYMFILRYVLHNIIAEQQLDIDENLIPYFQSDRSIQKLFSEFNDCFKMVCQALTDKRQSNNQALKNNIVAFITQNCSDPLFSTEAVALRFNISEQHVYRLVREHTGQSFGNYLESLRMELAIRLLSDTSRSVSSTALDCGFNVVNTFYRVFKKHYGVTPSTYRKKFE